MLLWGGVLVNKHGKKTSTRPGSQGRPHEIIPLPYYSPSTGCLSESNGEDTFHGQISWLQRWPEVWIKQTLGCQLMVWLVSCRPKGNKSKVWIVKIYRWSPGGKTDAVLQMKSTENYLLQRSPARWTEWWILRVPANLRPSTRLQVAQQLPIHVPPVSRMAALDGQHICPLPSSLLQSVSLLSAQPLQLHRPMWHPQYCTVPPYKDSIFVKINTALYHIPLLLASVTSGIRRHIRCVMSIPHKKFTLR